MPALDFSKWSPGGNTTLFFPAAGLDAARQADKQSLAPQIAEGERLSTLTVSLPEGTRYAYLLSEGRTFDLIEGEQGWQASVEKENLSADYTVVAVGADGEQTRYQ